MTVYRSLEALISPYIIVQLYSAAHDGVAFLSDSKNCRMYNCDVQVQTNTGVR